MYKAKTTDRYLKEFQLLKISTEVSGKYNFNIKFLIFIGFFFSTSIQEVSVSSSVNEVNIYIKLSKEGRLPLLLLSDNQ